MRWVLATATLLLVGCSTNQPSAIRTAVPVTTPCTASREPTDAATEMRRTVESGPMYEIVAATTDVLTCTIAEDAGVVTLEYRFRNGSWLRRRRNSSIEYTEEEARFASPILENPIEVLKREEQHAFTHGCGIEWQQPEIEPLVDVSDAREAIYRGNICNCQARIRTDAGGRVTGLTLRSAC
jgi:hypothetical protein